MKPESEDLIRLRNVKYQIIVWNEDGMAIEWSDYYDTMAEAEEDYIKYLEGTDECDNLEITIECV